MDFGDSSSIASIGLPSFFADLFSVYFCGSVFWLLLRSDGSFHARMVLRETFHLEQNNEGNR